MVNPHLKKNDKHWDLMQSKKNYLEAKSPELKSFFYDIYQQKRKKR